MTLLRKIQKRQPFKIASKSETPLEHDDEYHVCFLQKSQARYNTRCYCVPRVFLLRIVVDAFQNSSGSNVLRLPASWLMNVRNDATRPSHRPAGESLATPKLGGAKPSQYFLSCFKRNQDQGSRTKPPPHHHPLLYYICIFIYIYGLKVGVAVMKT
ncbi:hypothetical protein GGR51DRAFT_450452 [Nemania sp. FL0031]|nr:hypothetical protein GGR51DRAFT_450452 [Nemania sp. FL0031]